MPAPKTLEELAQMEGIELSEMVEFDEDLFKMLLTEQGVNATAQHRLLKKFRDAKASVQTSSPEIGGSVRASGWCLVAGCATYTLG